MYEEEIDNKGNRYKKWVETTTEKRNSQVIIMKHFENNNNNSELKKYHTYRITHSLK